MNGALARERRRLRDRIGPDATPPWSTPSALPTPQAVTRGDSVSGAHAEAPPKVLEADVPQPGVGVRPGLALGPAGAWSAPWPGERDHGNTPQKTAKLGTWRLKALPVCASTELELDRWLERLAPGSDDPLSAPLAVIARRQRFGRGQQGRLWQSPAGGVWLSAALPWPADPAGAAAPGLAAAVGLALQLEALGLELRLKWPNDLLLAAAGRPAKLAGLLPRLRLRGGVIRWARVGLGLNGCNPVPPGATNLVRELGPSLARPERLAARVLRALEWAMAMADQPQRVRELAEQRLLVAPGSWDGAAEGWQPCGLANDGALLLARGEERRLIRRRFD